MIRQRQAGFVGLPVLGSARDIPGIVEARRVDEDHSHASLVDVIRSCGHMQAADEDSDSPGMYDCDGKVSEAAPGYSDRNLGAEPVRMDMKEIGTGRPQVPNGAGALSGRRYAGALLSPSA